MTSVGSGGVMGARSTSGVLPGDALRPDTAIGSLAPAWLTDGSKLRSALVDGPRQEGSLPEKGLVTTNSGPGSARRGESLPASIAPFGGPYTAGQQTADRWAAPSSSLQRGAPPENNIAGRRKWRDEERAVPNRQPAPQPRWSGHKKEPVGPGGWSAEDGAQRNHLHMTDFKNSPAAPRRSSDRWVADSLQKGGTPGRTNGAQSQGGDSEVVKPVGAAPHHHSQQPESGKAAPAGGAFDRWGNPGDSTDRWASGSESRPRWGATGHDVEARSNAPLSPHGGVSWQSNTGLHETRRGPPGGGFAPGGPAGHYGVRGPPNGLPGVASDAGRGRGFGMGRGRAPAGGQTSSSSADVAPNWTAGKIAIEESSPHRDISSGRLQYSQEQTLQVLRSLRQSPTAALPLPDGVTLRDLDLEIAAGQVNVESILGTSLPRYSNYAPQNPPSAAQAAAADLFSMSLSHGDDGRETADSSNAAEQHVSVDFKQLPAEPTLEDEWLYRDPKGEVQGPFARADILSWYEDGFFPVDLPIRAASSSGNHAFVPLSSVLRQWGASPSVPPGFSSKVSPRGQQSQQQQQQQQQVLSSSDFEASVQPVPPSAESHTYNDGSSQTVHQFPANVQLHQSNGGPLVGKASSDLQYAEPSKHAVPPPSPSPSQVDPSGGAETSLPQANVADNTVLQTQQSGTLMTNVIPPLSSTVPHTSRPTRQQPQQFPYPISSASNGGLAAGAERPRPRLSAFERMRQGSISTQPAAAEDDISQVLSFLLPAKEQQQQQSQIRQYPHLPEELSIWDNTASSGAGEPRVAPIPEWLPLKHTGFSQPPSQQLPKQHPEHVITHSINTPQSQPRLFHDLYREQPPLASPWLLPEQPSLQQPRLAPQLPLAMSLPQAQPVTASHQDTMLSPSNLHHGPTHDHEQQQQQQQMMLASSPASWQPLQPTRAADKQSHKAMPWQQEQEQVQVEEAHHNPGLAQQYSAPFSHEATRSAPAAPWAAAAPTAAPVAGGGSLIDIQREEALRSAHARAAAQAVSLTAAQSHSAWARVAAGSSTSAGGLQDVMAEEQRRRQASLSKEAPSGTTIAAPQTGGVSGFTLGDYVTVADRPQPNTSAWKLPNADASSPAVVNTTLLEQQRRVAAQMKAEFAAQQQKGVTSSKAVTAPTADDHMFWDYGPSAAQPPQSRKSQAPRSDAGTSRSEAKQQQQQQQGGAPRGDSIQNGVTDDTSNGVATDGPVLSPGFRNWCQEQMKTLRGDPDLSLVEFLVSLASSGETVDYIQLYLKDTVSKEALASFTTEFLRRKLNDQAGGKRKGKANAAQVAAPKPSAPARAAALAAPASDWAKIPKKAKGKKSKPVATAPPKIRSGGFTALAN